MFTYTKIKICYFLNIENYLINTSALDQLQLIIFSILLLSGVLFLLSFENPENLLRQHDASNEASSIYECGFEPFKDPQEFFFIQYFPLAILFLLFDLELVFFIPWVLAPSFYIAYNFFFMFLFFFAVIIGLVLEWRAGSLNWLKIQQT